MKDFLCWIDSEDVSLSESESEKTTFWWTMLDQNDKQLHPSFRCLDYLQEVGLMNIVKGATHGFYEVYGMKFGTKSLGGEWQTKVRKVAMQHPDLEITNEKRQSINRCLTSIRRIFNLYITFDIPRNDTVIFNLHSSMFLANRLRPFELSFLFKMLRMSLVFKGQTNRISDIPNVIDRDGDYLYSKDSTLLEVMKERLGEKSNAEVLGDMSKHAIGWAWRDYMEGGIDALEASEYEDEDEDINYNPTTFHNTSGFMTTMKKTFQRSKRILHTTRFLNNTFIELAINDKIMIESQFLLTGEEVERRTWSSFWVGVQSCTMKMYVCNPVSRLDHSFQHLKESFNCSSTSWDNDTQGYRHEFVLTEKHLRSASTFIQMIDLMLEYARIKTKEGDYFLDKKGEYEEAAKWFRENTVIEEEETTT